MVHVEIGNERAGKRIIAVIVIREHMDKAVDKIGKDVGSHKGKYLSDNADRIMPHAIKKIYLKEDIC